MMNVHILQDVEAVWVRTQDKNLLIIRVARNHWVTVETTATTALEAEVIVVEILKEY